MKRILFIAFAVVLLASCAGKDSYRIKGEIKGVEDGTTMILGILEYDGLTSLDSTVIKGGKFSFKGKTDTAQVAVVTFDMGETMRGCQFYLERGNIEILIDAESGNQYLAGTPNNDTFQKFYDDTEVFNDEYDEIEDRIRITLASQGDASEFYAQMSDLQDRFTALLAQSIEENAGKFFAYNQLIENYSMFEPEVTMDLLEKLAPTFGGDIMFNQLTAMISAQLSTSLGHPYIDFEASILDKKYAFTGKAKLSDYIGKNKIVLLDFWASWCTPCLNEIPNLKAAYKKFKSKGFEIVSVSVDDGTDEWIKAVKDNGMNWVQLWNGEDMVNSAAVKYSITAIPSTFLIDADGTIIGRNLRDKELEEALEDYFKK
ncbi:MAG: AhpC/TSA family protein [Bacteroidaceae bacterium]|nr:AhpC/TSA family protein [Bacteroidaceae bacterium]